MPHVVCACLLTAALVGAARADVRPLLQKGKPRMETIPGLRCRFGGELGARIDRNVEHWLLRAPGANPGMLDMFRRRDRHLPYAEIVPWAGEFAGKFLTSAVLACRTTDAPRLRPFVQRFADALIATQADDGYMGPFPRARRLRGDCDLWGHYHCMLGLLLWHDDTGDKKAYEAVLRAAECIARLYVDGGRRPIEAGNPNFNLCVYDIFAELYRRTADPRYLALIRRIEEDLPKDGDWLRKGVEGVPYFRLPGSGPRWEALHLVQGFAKLYQATGDEGYKKALLSHWESIRQLDRHPSGAFSTNEQASGTIFAAGSIETCCSVAWSALTVDALRLTGDPGAADELEMTLWNQALAAQHPSGSWCTYDTPLNGVRAPSYHQINFQYRPGAPELNCCSVNNPRILGMLSEWAVMRDGAGLAVNFYGPGTFDVPRDGGSRVRLVQKTTYPVGADVRLEVTPSRKARFALRLRIPAWSEHTRVAVNGEPAPQQVRPGSYLSLDRTWSKGDVVDVAFDMKPRYLPGEGPDRGGRAAISVGPLLLAFDTGHNAIESAALRPVDVTRLDLKPLAAAAPADPTRFPPMGLWRIATDGGPAVTLCDFASAGAEGTEYAAWLPASHMRAPAAALLLPAQGATGKPGPVMFHWTASGGPEDTYHLVVARDPQFEQVVVDQRGLKGSMATVSTGLEADGEYYWKVLTHNDAGATENRGGPRVLHVARRAEQPFLAVRDDGLMLSAPLDGSGAPAYGVLEQEAGVKAAAGRSGRAGGALAFAGPGSGLRYALPFFPERDVSFVGWVCPEGLPAASNQQVFSAWCRGMDDPLRVVLVGSQVFARIEGGGMWGTQGFTLENGRWAHLAAVKEGPTLTLYVDGKAVQSVGVPEYVRSQSTQVGIGYNPLFGGGEHFVGRIDDVSFYARALGAAEVRQIYERSGR